MAVLVAMFGLQTFLVYTDPTGRDLPSLSQAASEGREIWLSHNCQVCHQFYGFGGFLGPDLTNASSRLDRARLDSVLTEGIAQMPAFHLSPREISAVAAYLREMDGTGVGQARAPRPDPSRVAVAVRESVARSGLADAVNGADLFLGGVCAACHAALAPQRIGPIVAPDLSVSASQLSDDEILGVLESGRPERGMPPSGLSDDQRRQVLAFLRWFAASRPDLVEASLSGEPGGIPWWEFR